MSGLLRADSVEEVATCPRLLLWSEMQRLCPSASPNCFRASLYPSTSQSVIVLIQTRLRLASSSFSCSISLSMSSSSEDCRFLAGFTSVSPPFNCHSMSLLNAPSGFFVSSSYVPSSATWPSALIQMMRSERLMVDSR